MSKHVAVYARVSTKKQTTKSQDPDLQRWADQCDQPVKRYADKASGTTMDRPAWNKLEAAIRAGKVASVVVWRLDRLGRTASGLTALFDLLQKHKVNLVSLKDGLDLSTPAGRLMANVLASVAQFETEVRGERIIAGQDVARQKGKTWGGSPKGKRKKIKPPTVRGIKRMKAEGESIAAIARSYKCSRMTVYSVLNE